MSINWVMKHETQGFVRLPGEKPIYKSPPRTSLSLTTPKAYPANSNSVSISSDSGTLYLTNQRVVFLPAKPVTGFESFSAPLLNLHDTHVTVPWFGPNAWQALVQPVHGGNLPPASTGIELKITFKEGGAPDFHSNFERIKERLQQAVENARDSGAPNQNQRQNGGALRGVDMSTVHIDQLPSYEASSQDRMAPLIDLSNATEPSQTVPRPAQPEPTPSIDETTQPEHTQSLPPPSSPPGYEETQQQSLQQELDRRLLGQ